MRKVAYYKSRDPPRREMLLFWKDFQYCSRVLDVGCGTGSFGKHKQIGVEVYGIDIDEGAIGIAKKHEKASIHDISKKLPFADNFFDGILLKDVLEHLNEPWHLVKECRRVLRKGGVVVATVPSPSRKAWDDYTHVRPFTKRSITELFLDNGFLIVYAKPVRGVPLAGKLGLTDVISVGLRIPGISLLAQGYKVKARKLR